MKKANTNQKATNQKANTINNLNMFIEKVKSGATVTLTSENCVFTIKQVFTNSASNTKTTEYYCYTAQNMAEKSAINTAYDEKPKAEKAGSTFEKLMSKTEFIEKYDAKKIEKKSALVIEKSALYEKLEKLMSKIDATEKALADVEKLDAERAYAKAKAEKLADALKTKEGKRAIAKIADEKHIDKADVIKAYEQPADDFEKDVQKQLKKALCKIALA